MALTPNYSWPTPDNTDLVKDGAEAIRDLGNAIDNTVNSLPSGGLVHIVTTDSGGSVASFSVDNVFSADYRNYKIYVNLTGSTGEVASIRLRAGGVDNSTASSYVAQLFQAAGTSTSASRTTSNIAGLFTYSITPLKSAAEILIYRPFEAVQTVARSISSDVSSGATLRDYIFSHNQTVSYDGFTLFAGSGTFNIEKISVYGLSEG